VRSFHDETRTQERAFLGILVYLSNDALGRGHQGVRAPTTNFSNIINKATQWFFFVKIGRVINKQTNKQTTFMQDDYLVMTKALQEDM